MKLGIISDAHHYFDAQGRLCTLTPLAKQFEQWTTLFKEVIVCAPLRSGDPPPMCSAYNASNLTLLPITNAGGDSWQAKLHLVQQLPGWVQTLRQLLKQVDAIHIRCPNNISILGLLLLWRSSHLCQAVYTGPWVGYANEPVTYWWQRFMLKHFFRGPVAVYGAWPQQPSHIVPSFSPSYRLSDWEKESSNVEAKITRLESLPRLGEPIRLLSVGSLDWRKNQQLVIRSLKVIQNHGLVAHLTLLGDGPLRSTLEQLTDELDLRSQVHFNGYTSYEDVRQFYRQTDFVVQATRSEAFGKVPIEAFFHGAIPILSDVDLSSQFIGNSERGRCFPLEDISSIANHVNELSQNPQEMIRLIRNGRLYAHELTLEAWRDHIRVMLESFWGISLSTS
ncbi:MAG: glycosyltransferase family 4 protein [Chloroflexi bacterium]|nr:glycosyltransferase family 4 protein [Chloroflexota bacterium]MBP8054547.1 glycosyltransferase family 4 protein [Chloroflexota bacterium]